MGALDESRVAPWFGGPKGPDGVMYMNAAGEASMRSLDEPFELRESVRHDPWPLTLCPFASKERRANRCRSIAAAGAQHLVYLLTWLSRPGAQVLREQGALTPKYEEIQVSGVWGASFSRIGNPLRLESTGRWAGRRSRSPTKPLRRWRPSTLARSVLLPALGRFATCCGAGLGASLWLGGRARSKREPISRGSSV
jgi:hypothetical protein